MTNQLTRVSERSVGELALTLVLPWVVALVAATGLYRTVAAQDSHYGTHLYGDRSTLLGGAVIASVDDASAAYYNPGALANVALKDVFLGTKVFDATRITLRQTGGQDLRIDTDNLDKAPSFVGGMIPIQSKGHRFAYSFFKRASFKVRITATAVDAPTEVVDPNTESNRLNLDFDASLNDDWMGISWAYSLTPTTSVGITNFFSYRSHRLSALRSVEWYRNDGTLSTGTVTREFKYSYLSALWKLGVTHRFNDELVLGWSLTTPSVGFGPLNDGSAGASVSVARANENSGGSDENIFLADFQKKLPATYKSPVVFGFGGSYGFPKRTVHASAEWFGPVDAYDVLDPEQFIGQSSGDTLDHLVVGGASSVLNLSIGLEEHLARSVNMYFGFHTDFSSARKGQEGSVYITEWDLYHFSGGSQFLFGSAQITLGLGYAFGRQKSNKLITIDDILKPEDLVGDEKETSARFSRLKFIIGFGVRT